MGELSWREAAANILRSNIYQRKDGVAGRGRITHGGNCRLDPANAERLNMRIKVNIVSGKKTIPAPGHRRVDNPLFS